ncbi:PD-(D/E)XK motif protein [Actinoplanes sp. TBRC 11911]|uniref:PD-(D/E)XK motif protein n=1 Tax=Actinoplanes sp. TBRC 11911 TaxID=2729386 RepID=UPI00145EE97F|nr:PD-(D/E)XK motif protein [Actinoplanes sp. TBRC 11911]NMO53843.1 PD-(D/E)XK motif protein [Actinoplanes sp. TBRC 11911]
MSDLRTVITDHWTALSERPHGTSWLTSELPVEVAGARVLCALGPDGKRHLLVPIPRGETVQPDTRAAAVHLVPLALESGSGVGKYANLVLLRDDLAEIFTGLCADVVAALAADLAAPLVVVAQVLDGWHELFRSGRQLGIEQLAGLFGELVFLNQLLDLDGNLVRAWQGPLRNPHDFTANGQSVEVKATASSEGRSVRIHGVDQLAAPLGGDLVLRWMRLDTADAAGTSLPELVESTVARVARPRELWDLLARSGYLLADRERYDGIRFTAVDEASYRVTDDFPRIVPSSFLNGVPAGLSDLRYTLDLDLAPPPMQKDEIADFMKAMANR